MQPEEKCGAQDGLAELILADVETIPRGEAHFVASKVFCEASEYLDLVFLPVEPVGTLLPQPDNLERRAGGERSEFDDFVSADAGFRNEHDVIVLLGPQVALDAANEELLRGFVTCASETVQRQRRVRQLKARTRMRQKGTVFSSVAS